MNTIVCWLLITPVFVFSSVEHTEELLRAQAENSVQNIYNVYVEPSNSVQEKSAVTEELNKAPKFCHGIDCPRFTVSLKTENYEERQYESTKWASTVVSGMDLSKALSNGFLRLFDYISGANEKSAKIPMTAPVRTLVTPGEGPFCDTNFTISFFVPFDFQDDTPLPSSPDVFLTSESSATYYVHSFGGYAREDVMIEKAAALAETLLADSLDFESETYFLAGYDPPFRPINRHNEIWFGKK